MRRGFKALAERNSLAARQAMGLSAISPIDSAAYAKHLGVVVLEMSELDLSSTTHCQLTVTDSDSWSAMTLDDNGIKLIVINPTHAPTRRQADLMHELSHIQLAHTPARVEVSTTGVLLLSDFSDEQEQEADWHAAALLVPRDGILQMRAQSASTAAIAAEYGVSEALCEWRIRMTGVDVQMRRRKTYGA